MTRMVKCAKLARTLEALSVHPHPGELGERIYLHVSKEAWEMWLGHQTMLINEYRLTPVEPRDRSFLEQEMEKFFFGDGSQMPPDYQPEMDDDKAG